MEVRRYKPGVQPENNYSSTYNTSERVITEPTTYVSKTQHYSHRNVPYTTETITQPTYHNEPIRRVQNEEYKTNSHVRYSYGTPVQQETNYSSYRKVTEPTEYVESYKETPLYTEEQIKSHVSNELNAPYTTNNYEKNVYQSTTWTNANQGDVRTVQYH